MQRDACFNRRPRRVAHARRTLFPAAWIFLFGVLVDGCGGGDSASVPVATSQQNSSEQSRSVAASMLPEREKSALPTLAEEAAVPSATSPAMVQLNALPQLSSLSAREKAGLLMLLPSKSPPQRLALINMYPSLAHLTDQQQELLLDKLEKIVPVSASQRQ